MNEIKRMLIPVDFGRGDRQTLRHAVVSADRLGAELHLLHVVTGPLSRDGGMMSFPEMEGICAGMYSEAMRCYRALPEPRQEGDLSLQCAVRRHTEVARAILEYADNHQIDLIVLGPYGFSQGGRIVAGRTAEKVMRLASCAVLTSGLQGLHSPELIRRIMAPVDFSSQAALALERARKLAKQLQAHLTVLHVAKTTLFPGKRPGSVIVEAQKSHEVYTELERFYRSAKGPDVPHLFSVLRGHPADRIACFADQHHIHLIVQGSRGRSGIEYAMLGSVAEAVVRMAPCPVLTVKIPARAFLPDFKRKQERSKREAPFRVSALPERNLKTEAVL